MDHLQIPGIVPNRIAGTCVAAGKGHAFDDVNPATGKKICEAARSDAEDVAAAVESARRVQPQWAAVPGVKRGEVLFEIVALMERHRKDLAEIVSVETGKSMKASASEVDGAMACGRFMAGEGQRLFGRTMPTAGVNKSACTVREPMGVAGLIIAANTPIANVAWKVFPALICGNGVVLKSADDAPLTSWAFGEVAARSALPPGLLNIVHGFGEEAGAPLVRHSDVDVLSFTGSAAVGRFVARTAGERLAKVSLELGGKKTKK